MALVECNNSFLKGLAEIAHIYSNSQSTTLQLPDEEPREVHLAATSLKALALPISVAAAFEEGRWRL
jgi:hypothetical protein